MALLNSETIALLSKATIFPSKVILGATLPPDDYVTIAKACALFDGKWSKSQRAIVFPRGTAELSAALAGAAFVDVKKDLGFFPTPPLLARGMCERVGISREHLCLEPSAGPGQLVAAMHEHGAGWIDAVEIHPPHVEVLRWSRAPNGSMSRFNVLCADFLTLLPEPIYDRIVMNPPFSGPGTRAADATHIVHAWHFLKPGGRLVAIASAGLTFRDDHMTSVLRDAAEKFGTINPLPAGTFKPSGTEVETCMVTLNKPQA